MMLDPKILKESPDKIKNMLIKRRVDFPLDELIELDKRRRELIIEAQDAKHRKNLLSEAIAIKKKQGRDASTELEQMKQVGTDTDHLQKEQQNIESRYLQLMMAVPNLIDDSVPIGKDENDNVVIKKISPSEYKFEPKDHVEIATSMGLVDIERASKISGARFYFLKNDLVRLNQALINCALDTVNENKYVLIQPPFMIRREAMQGAVILNDFEEVIYKIDGEDLYMIGTSEHAMASMHMNEILEGKNLPLRYAGISPCFRKEAGAHGKDMKGIFRVHQFEKVEQFVYSRPEDSAREHEKMLAITEKFYERLGIPYQVKLLCSADLGKISAKTFDIEAWMPGQRAYREVVSCSNCLDYQARRLKIRFRDRTNEETRLVHTLNSTVVATERTMVAILENFQTQGGKVEIPEILRKYMGDQKEISI